MSEIEDRLKRAIHRIPPQIIEDLRITLLQRWEGRNKTVILFPEIKPKEYPALYFFGILAKDWPGLAESVAGVITEVDWNIETSWGMTLSYKGEKIAIMVYGIKAQDREHLTSILNKEGEIKERLYKMCLKGLHKKTLLTHGIRKVELFEDVVKSIEHTGRTNYGVMEEAMKFFDSRTEDYLESRNPKDLANLILANYDFINKVRKSGGRPQVKVEHLHTKKELLTGISIACFDRDFSLLLALDAIRGAIPYCNVKCNKEFITDDGISVYRIEIEGSCPLKPIEHSIIKKMMTRKFERVRLTKAFGGIEHYINAIIPKLIKEHSLTNIPQVYIGVSFASEQFIQFKLIVVKSPTYEWADKLIASIDGEKGFSILSYELPKLSVKSEVSIFNLRVDIRIFPATESIYSIIREKLKSMIGDFRDFDEGMRRLDVTRFVELKQKISHISRGLLRELYYGIDDFYRISAPEDEIIKSIKLGAKLATLGEPQIKFIKLNENYTLVGIVSKKKLLSMAMNILAPYEPAVNRVQLGDLNIYLLRICEHEKSLTHEKVSHLTQKLTQLL